jgi:hypothetical protein
MDRILRMLVDRQLSPLYVPTVVTLALLLTIVGFAATIWTIAEQRERWAAEDARNGPRFKLTITSMVKPDRYRYAQLVVTNTRPHDYLQLVRIEAVAPSGLLFTEVTNPVRWTLRGEPRRSLDISDGYIPPNGTYSMNIALRTDRTPGSDQGEEIELVVEAMELAPDPRTLKHALRFPIPADAAKQ